MGKAEKVLRLGIHKGVVVGLYSKTLGAEHQITLLSDYSTLFQPFQAIKGIKAQKFFIFPIFTDTKPMEDLKHVLFIGLHIMYTHTSFFLSFLNNLNFFKPLR